MLRGAVAGRYAQALYDIAEEKNIVDELEQELKQVAGVVKEYGEVHKILDHPRVTAAQKKELLSGLFGGRVSEVVENFLALLVDKRRETFLLDIIDEYINIADRARNVVEARVSSAVELTAEEKDNLVEALRRITGKEVRPAYSVDATLLGGVVVRIGDKVLDGSVRNYLAALGERLRQIEVREIGVNQ